MTVYELITRFSFDELVPYIQKCYQSISGLKSEQTKIYPCRELYERLPTIKLDESHRGEMVLISSIGEQYGIEGELVQTIEDIEDYDSEEEAAAEILAWWLPRPRETQIMTAYYFYRGLSRLWMINNSFGPSVIRYEKALRQLWSSINYHTYRREYLEKRKGGYYEVVLGRVRTKRKTKNGTKWTILPPNWWRTKANRSKRKREYRHEKRKEYLKTMLLKHAVWDYLCQEGSSLERESMAYVLDMSDIKIDQLHAITPKEPLRFIYESITNYNDIDFSKHHHAIVYIEKPSEWVISEEELKWFKEQLTNFIGYEQIRWGYRTTDRTELDVTLIRYNLEETCNKK